MPSIDTTTMNGYARTLAVQWRVIHALILRETKTLYGNSMLGALWVILEPCLTLGQIWILFTITGMSRTLPFDMSVSLFIITGEGTWLLFSTTVTKLLPSIRANKTLMSYPQVTPLDVLLGRAILNGIAKLLVFFCLLAACYATGAAKGVPDIGRLLSALVLAWLLGLGLGIITASLCVVRPSVEKIVGASMRLLFFVSGAFFGLNAVPFEFREFILLNPLFHFVELTRSSFSPAYAHDDVNVLYPLSVTLPLLFLGLVLLRNVRRKIDLV